MKTIRWFALFAIFSVAALSQSATGVVTGQIRDASGGAVPGAKVTLKDRGTEMTRTVTTGPTGVYRFPLMPIGTYDLTVEKEGFHTLVQEEVEVHVSEAATVDLALQVGSVHETVTVTERPSLLQSASTEMGGLVDRKYIEDLPLSRPGAREMSDSFTLLLPGVNTGQDRTPGRFTGEGYTSNGSQAYSRDLLVEGAAYVEMDSPGRMISQIPPPSAIQEFKMSTGTYSAEFGKSQGGLIQVSIRSGTNQIHGSLNEGLRNNVFDARGFFPTVKSQDTQNEFGGTFGGPLVIPHVYNGHNKTFFFGYYSGFRWRTILSNSLATIPTASMLKGNFSQELATNQIVYDPATNFVDSTGNTARNAFPGNIVPASRFSAISSNIVPLLPLPTYGSRTLLNYLAATTEATNDDHFGFKIDHAISSRQQLSGYFQYGTFYRDDLGPMPLPVAEGSLRTQYTRMVRLSDQVILRPNLVLFTQFALNRDQTPYGLVTMGQDWSKLGLTGIPPDAGFPYVSFGTGYSLYTSNAGEETTSETSFLYQVNLNWTKNRHSIKFGAEIRRQRFDDRNYNRAQGQFDFSPSETDFPYGTTHSTTGDGFASFLLGAVDNSTVYYVTTVPGYRFTYATGFIQDDYKVSHTLTLNIGLRYEIPWPMVEAFNRLSFFSPTAPNPAAGGIPGALVFAGYGPGKMGSRTVENTYFRDFGPRIGLAWAVTPKTVVRAAYGIFYGSNGGTSMDGPGNYSLTQGYNANWVVSSTNSGITPTYYWDHGVPGPTIQYPTLNPAFLNGTTITDAVQPGDDRVVYVQNWNLTIQRQLGQNLVVQAAYVGSKGTNLSADLDRPNTLPEQYLALGSLLTQSITSQAAKNAGIPLPYPGFTGTVEQALLPFPQYATIEDPFEDDGNSTYHSLQATANKRMANGLSFLASYTFSKSLTNSFSQIPASDPAARNAYNWAANKSVSTNQIPQVLTYSAIYELPFGKGKRFLSGAKGAGKALVSGWSASVVSRYQSGFSLAISNNVVRVLGVQQRSSVPASQFNPLTSDYLNPAAYIPVSSLLNIGANVPIRDPNLRGWAYYDEDVSLIRQFAVTEKVRLQLSGQAYNILNRVVFSDPNTTYGSALFGKVSGQANNPRQMQFRLRLTF